MQTATQQMASYRLIKNGCAKHKPRERIVFRKLILTAEFMAENHRTGTQEQQDLAKTWDALLQMCKDLNQLG